MVSIVPSAPIVPARAKRRAGPASSGGRNSAVAAPALVARDAGEAVQQRAAARDPTAEEVERDFRLPHRLLDDRPAVVRLHLGADAGDRLRHPRPPMKASAAPTRV